MSDENSISNNSDDNDLSASNFSLGLMSELEQNRKVSQKKRSEIDAELDRFIHKFEGGKYLKQIYQVIQEQRESIVIDFNDIMNCSTVLWEIYVQDPKEFMSWFKERLYVMETGITDDPYFKRENYLNIRITNHFLNEKISKISVKHIDKLVSIRGNVAKISERRPYIHKFCMKCRHCEYQTYSDQEGGECPDCEDNPRLRNNPKDNIYTTCYYIRVQELNEDLEGKVPMQLECIVLGDLCDVIRAGMKISMSVFIFLRKINSSVSERTPFVLSAVANNVTPLLSNDLENLEKARITEEDEAWILNISKDKPRLLTTLLGSYAPHILGHEMVKLGNYLAIVGAGKIYVEGVTLRDRMNILMVGDPGTSKTEMLVFGEKITVGSVRASAKGVSGGGITALTLKEKDGTFSIQPGALIYANGSVFYFDEADKTTDEVRGHLHEAMESGTITIMKGGQMAVLQAQTTVVFAANPRFSRYDSSISLPENINLPDSLISRFDLIFLLKDVINEEQDRAISKHIDSIYVNRKIPTYGKDILSIRQLIKYLTYVKKQDIDPEISKEVLDMYEDYYVEMRNKSTPESIAITPRQKHGMLRLTRALCRLLLDRKATKFHGDIILKLMKIETQTVYTDKDGNVNIAEAEGKTLQSLKGAKLMITILKRLENDYPREKLPKKRIREILAEENNMAENNIEKFLTEMNDRGIISHTSEGYVKRATND